MLQEGLIEKKHANNDPITGYYQPEQDLHVMYYGKAHAALINKKMINTVTVLTLALAACAPVANPNQSDNLNNDRSITLNIEEIIQSNIDDPENFNLGLVSPAIDLQPDEITYLIEGSRLILNKTGNVIGVALPATLNVSTGTSLIFGAVQDVTEGNYGLNANQVARLRGEGYAKAFFIQEDQIIAENGQVLVQFTESEAAEDIKNNSLDYTQSNQPPEGWKPPTKVYCGEDMEEYYTLMFLKESVTTFINAKELDTFLNSNLIKGMDEYSKKSDAISNRLKERNCYFYENGGSVFSDFKYMRNKFWQRDGAAGDWARNNLSLDMPTSQAYELTQQLISTWGW